MQYEPVYLPSTSRAAIVRAYREKFNPDYKCRKTRAVSFENAMRMRARWLCGDSAKELAARYCRGKLETAVQIVSGTGWLNPTVEELPHFEVLVEGFYSALDACDVADTGEGAMFPLEQFARGEWTPPEDEGDDCQPRQPGKCEKDGAEDDEGEPEYEEVEKSKKQKPPRGSKLGEGPKCPRCDGETWHLSQENGPEVYQCKKACRKHDFACTWVEFKERHDQELVRAAEWEVKHAAYLAQQAAERAAKAAAADLLE